MGKRYVDLKLNFYQDRGIELVCVLPFFFCVCLYIWWAIDHINLYACLFLSLSLFNIICILCLFALNMNTNNLNLNTVHFKGKPSLFEKDSVSQLDPRWLLHWPNIKSVLYLFMTPFFSFFMWFYILLYLCFFPF